MIVVQCFGSLRKTHCCAVIVSALTLEAAACSDVCSASASITHTRSDTHGPLLHSLTLLVSGKHWSKHQLSETWDCGM